ncbi:hypothetical protein ACFYO2_08650 [Streptomyces sp. NPDC006602]|uniref:hypothetical protein n=1 Tax=Streptomyces sp. NPDC006602 TaxID=3364751 RepID=UPI0036AD7930
MGHHDEAWHGPVGASAPGPGAAVHDRRWVKEMRSALHCAATLLGLLLVIDWGEGCFALWRSLLWLSLGLLLFAVLCPPQVRAGEGWLASRGLLSERLVRTDLLVSASCPDGVSRRLVLRDALGGRVEIDPQVLVDNPDLWHRLGEDAQTSLSSGSLTCGAPVLGRLSRRVERETAQRVFKISGLE